MAPVLLDLFGCECGAAAGYAAAGFEVYSVELEANRAKYNPHSWYVGDWALGLLSALHELRPDVIHASPPCQAHSRTKHLATAQGSNASEVELIPAVRRALDRSGLPYVIENVPEAPLRRDVTLCGSMFGLPVQRHRVFESNVLLFEPDRCRHDLFPRDPRTGKPRPWGVYGSFRDEIPSGGRTVRSSEHAAEVLGVEHPMTQLGYRECIPPVYATYLGHQLLAYCPVPA